MNLKCLFGKLLTNYRLHQIAHILSIRPLRITIFLRIWHVFLLQISILFQLHFLVFFFVILLDAIIQHDAYLAVFEGLYPAPRDQVHQDGLLDAERVELFFEDFADQQFHDYSFDAFVGVVDQSAEESAFYVI